MWVGSSVACWPSQAGLVRLTKRSVPLSDDDRSSSGSRRRSCQGPGHGPPPAVSQASRSAAPHAAGRRGRAQRAPRQPCASRAGSVLRELVSVLAAQVAALLPQSVAWPLACGVDGARADVTKERKKETMGAAAVAAADLAMAVVEGDLVAETAAARELVAAVGPETKKIKKTFSGTVLRSSSSWLGGACRFDGFITPNNPDSLPEFVKAALALPGALSSPSRGLYFSGRYMDPREDFVLVEGVSVTFQVKVDHEGAVACDVAPA